MLKLHAMPHARMPLVGLAASVLVTSQALGFGSDEHREISDLALQIAVDYSCSVTPVPAGCTQAQVDKTELLLPTYSYGSINELVDYMSHPEQIFERFQSLPESNTAINNIPLNHTHLNAYVFSLKDPSLARRWTAKFAATLDYFEASSDNERHFQHALLESMHYVHSTAVATAREGHLYKALVLNAMSDHYLNDYFAPGHITTPRENSHDTVALAMHDRANRAGSCYRIDPSTWNELEDILMFVKSNHAARSYDIVTTAEIEDDDDIARIRANLIECNDRFDVDITLEKLNSLAGRLEVQDEIIDTLTTSHDQVFMQGDGRLALNPRQRLFMLLVQVKSITEVLEAYLYCQGTPANGCGTAPPDFTTQYEWTGSYDIANYTVRNPHAKIRYGQYDFSYEADMPADNESVWIFWDRPRLASPAVADDALLLSFGGQTPVSQASSRMEFQAELFPLALGTSEQFRNLRNATVPRPSTDCNRLLCNLGFAYGLSHIDDDYFDATGLQIRIIKAFPKISGMFSLTLRRSQYQGRLEDNTESTYGIRYDHGFSLHTFYIGYQRDYVFDENNRFDRDNMIVFGWTVAFPMSRVFDFFGGYE